MKRFERESDQEDADYQARLRAERQLARREVDRSRLVPSVKYGNAEEEYRQWQKLQNLRRRQSNSVFLAQGMIPDDPRIRVRTNQFNEHLLRLEEKFSDPELRRMMEEIEARGGL